MTRDDIDPSSCFPANGLPDQNILVPASHELLQNQFILEFKPTSKPRPSSRLLHIMTKGKATAKVSGRTIAEADEYEIVEGNVYVRSPN
jgi:hypothetical protein